MGSPNDQQCEPLIHHQYQTEETETETVENEDSNNSGNKLSLIPLVFLIYFEVSGGPFGEETAVGAAGPLLAILGYITFPFIWSIPEALITAELATAFPGNGGFVVWAHRAFGPFWGSTMGTWKFLSGAVNLASFPVLCADYLQTLVPALASGWARYAAIVAASASLSLLNYSGLAIVGHAAVALGVLSYAPFVVMAVLAAPKIEPARWLVLGDGGGTDWTLFMNALFWSLNCWDTASTLAGEVKNAQRTYPKALMWAVVLTCMGYLVPLLAALGAVPFRREEWRDGYLAAAAGEIGGKWLEVWVGASAAMAVVGMFQAQLTSTAYQVLGMAELGILPKAFARRSRRFGTPWVGILVSALVPIPVALMGFADIISSANFVYSMSMVLELASFARLRWKMAATKRPFRVPFGTAGMAAVCLPPAAFLAYVMAVATAKVVAIGASLTAFAVAWYFFMSLCRSRMWLLFNSCKQQQEVHFDH